MLGELRIIRVPPASTRRPRRDRRSSGKSCTRHGECVDPATRCPRSSGGSQETLVMRMTPAVLRSKIVYLSMEIGLDPRVPTYSGGLGVLAGDVLRSAADLHVPIA